MIALTTRLETLAMKMGVDYYLLLDKVAQGIEVENKKLDFKLNIVELTEKEKENLIAAVIEKNDKEKSQTPDRANQKIDMTNTIYNLMRLQYFVFTKSVAFKGRKLQEMHDFNNSYVGPGQTNNKSTDGLYHCLSAGAAITSRIKSTILEYDLSGDTMIGTYKTVATDHYIFYLKRGKKWAIRRV